VAHPLFRLQDTKLAGWKAGLSGIVGLKIVLYYDLEKERMGL
jgi:hypothetical protein